MCVEWGWGKNVGDIHFFLLILYLLRWGKCVWQVAFDYRKREFWVVMNTEKEREQ